MISKSFLQTRNFARLHVFLYGVKDRYRHQSTQPESKPDLIEPSVPIGLNLYGLKRMNPIASDNPFLHSVLGSPIRKTRLAGATVSKFVYRNGVHHIQESQNIHNFYFLKFIYISYN